MPADIPTDTLATNGLQKQAQVTAHTSHNSSAWEWKHKKKKHSFHSQNVKVRGKEEVNISHNKEVQVYKLFRILLADKEKNNIV